MNTEWIYDQHIKCSPEDNLEWQRLVGRPHNHLPEKDAAGNIVPYGTGPQSLKAFRTFCVTHQPEKIFEIGFNAGFSANVFFGLGVKRVFSCEIRKSNIVDEEAAKLAAIHGEAFTLYNKASYELLKEPIQERFDSAFIDGGHAVNDIVVDITVARSVGVKKFLFDDFFPIHGDTNEAIQVMGLTVDWICGNMVACTDHDRSTFKKYC